MFWILSLFRISSPLSRVLGSEDTEDAEVAAARPVVSRETADPCFRASLQFLPRARAECGSIHVRSRPVPRIRDSRIQKSGIQSFTKIRQF